MDWEQIAQEYMFKNESRLSRIIPTIMDPVLVNQDIFQPQKALVIKFGLQDSFLIVPN